MSKKLKAFFLKQKQRKCHAVISLENILLPSDLIKIEARV